MCGIAGFWTGEATKASELNRLGSRMLITQRHRGPDDGGIWVDKHSGLVLGHSRLSVIDLSREARQPMRSPSGNTQITFNGEIYNFVELRRHLEDKGIKFRNHSDTEVLQALFEQYGLDGINSLHGMFAFALWDTKAKCLFLARDRTGKKPLYYCLDRGTLIFASEMKAIISVLPAPPSIDHKALDEYLSFGFVSGERTIYNKIRELPPGTALTARKPTDMAFSRYWTPQWEPKIPLGDEEVSDQADKLITAAIRERLRADVPVGVLLSGGIDSGLVTAIAARHYHKLKTFSVGFDDQQFDERQLAQQVARSYGTDHHEVLLKPDLTELLPKLVYHYDEPFSDSSAIPCFAIAEYAKRHVKVVLTGDGGDEVFAGYRRHAASYVAHKFSAFFSLDTINSLSKNLLSCLPTAKGYRTPYALLHKFIEGLASNRAEGLLKWYAHGFTREEKHLLYRVRPKAEYGIETFEAVLASFEHLPMLDSITALDLLWELPHDLLVKMDIASMAYGLEARSPFLDHRLIEWAIRLPGHARFRCTQTKPILRSVAKRYLPRTIVMAPKRGFEVPLTRWLDNELREMSFDLILSANGLACTILDRPSLERILTERKTNATRRAHLIWLLLMLSAWDRYCYQSRTSAQLMSERFA